MKRREFLTYTSGIGTGVFLMGGMSAMHACGNGTNGNYPFGIQLYTLRDAMPGDSEGVLRQISGFGYRQIESYEGPKGMFWGKTATDFASFTQDLGLDLIASHCRIDEQFEQKAAEAASAGMKWLVCPWIGPQPTLDAYRDQADLFNRCGEICRREGLRFAYHNHDYTFRKMEEVFPQDVIMCYTDNELVDFELDIYWLITAGEVAEAWLEKYPGRFVLSHVKDRRTNAGAHETHASCTLGTGSIDYARILPAAYTQGMRYFFVEQEAYDGTTPLESTKKNAAYMKQFRF